MRTRQGKGHPLGFHRVLDEPKVLPQNATKLDATPCIFSNEVRVAVRCLQVDSASFNQLKREYPQEGRFKETVLRIVSERGKLQNPVTGSGGMLLGSVEEIGKDYPDKSLKKNMKIATLVSLSATPLTLAAIESVDFKRERLGVRGQAILFEKSLYSPMPRDISEGAALAAFDVCGAPLLTVSHVEPGDTVFVMGLGKAGRSVVAGLRHQLGDAVRVLGADADERAVRFCNEHWQTSCAQLDCQDAWLVLRWVADKTAGQLADVTVNLVNVPNTEMPAILSTKDGGDCIFFSMATDFQKATLGAESVGKDVNLVMGRGFVRGHGAFMLKLLRRDEALRGFFEESFG